MTFYIEGLNFTAEKKEKTKDVPRVGDHVDITSPGDELYNMSVQKVAWVFQKTRKWFLFPSQTLEAYVYCNTPISLPFYYGWSYILHTTTEHPTGKLGDWLLRNGWEVKQTVPVQLASDVEHVA